MSRRRPASAGNSRAKPPTHHIPLSDDFSRDKFGIQWAFYDPGANEKSRVSYENGALVMAGKGDSPANCSPITCITGDHAYRCEVEIEVEGDATGGVLFFYNRRMYCGLGFSDTILVTGNGVETLTSGLDPELVVNGR